MEEVLTGMVGPRSQDEGKDYLGGDEADTGEDNQQELAPILR